MLPSDLWTPTEHLLPELGHDGVQDEGEEQEDLGDDEEGGGQLGRDHRPQRGVRSPGLCQLTHAGHQPQLPGLRDQPSVCCGLYTGWVLVFLALRLDTLLQLSARVTTTSNNNNKQVEKREGDGEGEKELAEKKTD